VVVWGGGGGGGDIVLVNASAALVAAGAAQTFRDGVKIASVSIDSGAAQSKAEALARFTCSL
jgi:anthranilate phosphoribosyltransferase